MFPILSMWLGRLADPATLLAILVIASAVAAVLRRHRASAVLLGLSTTMVLLVGVLPVPRWLAVPLEQRFAANPSLPDRIDGVIVLGGTEHVDLSAARGQPSLGDPTPIATWIAFGRRFPEAKLVFSGGRHAEADPAVGEASIVRAFIDEFGTISDGIIYEDRSRNTWENASMSYGLIKPKPGERWILVTQAIAMPRAVGAFRKAGWSVIPYPAGYLTQGNDLSSFSFDLLGGLSLSQIALHEWIGLLVYRILGYTDDLLPG